MSSGSSEVLAAQESQLSLLYPPGCLAAPQSLLKVSLSKSSGEVCCTDRNLLSCRDTLVFPELLANSDPIILDGVTVDFVSTVQPNGFVYQSGEGDEAIITYNSATGNLFGSFKTSSGKSYGIEKCSSGHTWKEFNAAGFKADSALETPEKAVTSPKTAELMALAAADNVTQATYSVMFYYTADFQAITSDIPGFIDQVLAETNQGYVNSGVPLTVTRFCIEAATINDIQDTSAFITAFRTMKKYPKRLRNTADAAALLSVDFNSCGVAYLNTISSGNTISICQKSCALGYYSFGHELGHNMGLTHNKEVASNSDYPHGHGYLIQAGSASTGARTILAYNAQGHSKRVNYYSNPSATYPVTGTALGVVGVSNNAAVLLENRLAMQAVGDESGSCSDGSTPPSTSSGTGATTAPPSTGSGTCGNCVFPFIYANRVHYTCTTIDGDPRAWCSNTVDENGVHVNGAGTWEYCTDPSCPGVTSPAVVVNPSNAVGSCCE